MNKKSLSAGLIFASVVLNGTSPVKKKLLAFFAVVVLTWAGVVNASTFFIDEFTVEKTDDSGVTTFFFQDKFDDDIAPKNISVEDPATVDKNPHELAYLLPYDQLPGEEANSKLAMDTADGKYNLSPVNEAANLQLGARVNSSQTSTDSAALGKDDQFVVEALFDLTLPQLTRERYGIRITDWTSTEQNEDIEITFARRADGEFRVLFRQADLNSGEFTVIQGWNPTLHPDFSDYDQIRLSIFNDSSDLDSFSASFTLIDTGDTNLEPFTRSSDQDKKGRMFQVSNWVRPEFFVNYTFPVDILTCEGFAPPADTDIYVRKPNRVVPLRMYLVDKDGSEVWDVAPPVLNVAYAPLIDGTPDEALEVDYAGQGDDGNVFVPTGGGWAFNLKTKGLAAGIYTLTVEPGSYDYAILPTCSITLTIE